MKREAYLAKRFQKWRDRFVKDVVQEIEVERLIGHSGNPNRMSKTNFGKLVRNIERSGLYEPLIVRRHPEKKNFFQIINGHHRLKALRQLKHKTVNCIVWDVDDEQTDILLATLNRLCGRDELGRKLGLLKRLSKKTPAVELAKLVPQTAKQIERLTSFKIPLRPVKIAEGSLATALVFFVNAEQKRVIEEAILSVGRISEKTKAGKRAEALTFIAERFINNQKGGG